MVAQEKLLFQWHTQQSDPGISGVDAIEVSAELTYRKEMPMVRLSHSKPWS